MVKGRFKVSHARLAKGWNFTDQLVDVTWKILINVDRAFRRGILRVQGYVPSSSRLLGLYWLWHSRIFLNLRSRKLQKLNWSAWFPYPSSWLRALILVPIAFPGARLIVFGFAGAIPSAIGNSPALLIFSMVSGLLIPTIILSFPYHFFWFIWKKQPPTHWRKWVPGSSSLWQAFYATVVIGISFLTILATFAGLWFLSCKLSHETAEELGGCIGRGAGRAAGAIFSSAESTFEGSGRGALDRPWFVIWLIIAAYLYQIEYLVKQRFLPWLKASRRNRSRAGKF